MCSSDLRLSLGPDGLGPSPEHIAHIMGQSMEALIHHFKLVTEGFRVPAGQAYVGIESPKGELGCHVVSDGGTQPYLDYETFEFDVPTVDTCDTYGRYLVRMAEMEQSMRIIEQCLDRLADRADVPNDPWMIQDAKIGWPARLSLGPDGMGPSPEHIAHIMGQSMEALIHHFKLVTEGFRVPAGQAYVPIESPKGELGCHVVSDGGTRPYRAHLRDPSFHHLQAVSLMCEGGNLADVIPAIASIDPVIGGVDR